MYYIATSRACIIFLQMLNQTTFANWNQEKLSYYSENQSGRINFERRDSHVCKHSVTVVASIKYPLHISHVICLLSECNFIRRSIIYAISHQLRHQNPVERTNRAGRSRTSNWPTRLLVQQMSFTLWFHSTAFAPTKRNDGHIKNEPESPLLRSKFTTKCTKIS